MCALVNDVDSMCMSRGLVWLRFSEKGRFCALVRGQRGGEVPFLLVRQHIVSNICSHGGALCSVLLCISAINARRVAGLFILLHVWPQGAVLILSWGLVMGTCDFKQVHALGQKQVVIPRSWAQQLRVGYR